jgi:meso-butanediol dehydrogenase/(S,S)-butanediol dehydrogenase/diacetyl reductase
MAQLSGKIAIVTGGSRGIGWGITTRFVKEGATVIVASRSAPPNLDHDAIHWHQTNVADRGQVEALTEFVVDTFGRVDLLVNNAGVQLEKRIVATTDEDWEWLTGINMRGVFFCCRSVIPVMQRQSGGVIINIGSIAAGSVDLNMALYNASKGFVHSLTRSIAVDHGRDGIRCNAICPGWIMTELAEQAFAQAIDPNQAFRTAVAQHPAGRLGQPEDIAAMAVWLAGDEAGFATGQFFTVDGGLTAGSPINPAMM